MSAAVALAKATLPQRAVDSQTLRAATAIRAIREGVKIRGLT